VEQVQPGLWRIVFNFPASTNCWLWQESDGLTLIDAGHPWNGNDILTAAKAIGESIKRIIITHAHPDHAGAAAEVAAQSNADVFVHHTEAGFLQGTACMADAPGSFLCRCVLGTGRMLRMLNPPPVKDVIPVAEGETVGSLKVLHTPGHTPGSISLCSEDGGTLFCGDNVCTSFGVVHKALPWFTLDQSTQSASLRRYTDLPAHLLLPGHGPPYRGDVARALEPLLPRR
jgi:glyoxylase-like metal-dependent hydrolase (beta-lactamase superfamily II)